MTKHNHPEFMALDKTKFEVEAQRSVVEEVLRCVYVY